MKDENPPIPGFVRAHNRIAVAQAVVMACAHELVKFQNPYPKGSPAHKAFRELASAERAAFRLERAETRK